MLSPIADVNGSQLSDAFADTEIEVDGTRGCISALIGLKARHTHLKVILSIGGGGPASSLFPHLASNDTSRQVFSKAVRDMVDAYSFDGVDSKSLAKCSGLYH